MSIRLDNERMLMLTAAYLCGDPCAVTQAQVTSVAASCGMTAEEAYLPVLSAMMGLDLDQAEDMRLYRTYLPQMVRRLDPALVAEDPYTRAVGFPRAQAGAIALTQMAYAPMELFVCDDFRRDAAGRLYPQLGWFDCAVPYPALTEDGRIWMTVTPNEINTIRPCAARCHGRVLAYGLGLGYFAFHALLREEVDSVTVVEKSAEVIDLFRRAILPHFPRADRLTIVHADAFEYARSVAPGAGFDVVFTDLWHDVSDGLPLYKRMKSLEFPGAAFLYWIEPTLRCYMEDA